jgi:Ca-activated chloride channel family protein
MQRPSVPRFVWILFPALTLVSIPWLAGQSIGGSSTTFRANTTLVLVPVTVTDAMNRFVLGLDRKNFHVLEDGVEQKITHFSGEDSPLSVGLVFDESGSMDYKLRTAREAVGYFLKTMNAADESFLIEFSDAAKLSLGFSSQFDKIPSVLEAARPGGLTAMIDAVEIALHEMKDAKNPRKAIIIISDGGDNNSKYTAAEVESLVRQADVQVYAMGVFEPELRLGLSAEEISGPRLLSEMANQTGGRAFSAVVASDLPSVAARIAVELRNEYVLAYSPDNQSKDGKYRHLEVKVTAPATLSSVKVHSRLGYYAPNQ